MKQYDLDAMGMRIERISSYMTETACLARVFAEISDNCCGYFVNDTDSATLANILVRFVRRLHKDVICLKNDFEFPISERH